MNICTEYLLARKYILILRFSCILKVMFLKEVVFLLNYTLNNKSKAFFNFQTQYFPDKNLSQCRFIFEFTNELPRSHIQDVPRTELVDLLMVVILSNEFVFKR